MTWLSTVGWRTLLLALTCISHLTVPPVPLRISNPNQTVERELLLSKAEVALAFIEFKSLRNVLSD